MLVKYASDTGIRDGDGNVPMKLVAAIIQDYDAAKLTSAIVDAGFRATTISSKGGFLRTGNVTILSAVEDDQVAELLAIVEANCRERTEIIRPDVMGDYADWYPPHDVEVLVGGANVFVIPVSHYERIM